ncbi:MAG: hypothetical protein VX803_12080 [Pseudomonadota bacterium]|nr:hypothetical protein [Pseudomonadota bacterium]
MTLEFDFSKLDSKLANLSRETQAEAQRVIRETAEQAIKIIVQRTRSKGVDKDGNPFTAYSKDYLAQRKKAGASSRVILTSAGATVSGKKRKGRRKSLRGNAQGGTMLNSVTIVRIDNQGTDTPKAVISVARPKELEKMRRHIQGDGVPKRNPFGFTTAEDKKLRKRASTQITSIIQRIGRR